MFTGIIEELGQVVRVFRKGRFTVLNIKAGIACQDTKIGDSISVNGCCLTVTENKADILSFELMPETLGSSSLRYLKLRDKVNLERALKVGERLSGHFVSGHIDCAGIIRRKAFVNGNLSFEICVPVKFIHHIYPKASVAIDGISLTMVNKKSTSFTVYIIAHTLKNTTLGFKGPSDKVNLEFDILTKAVV